MKNKIYNGLITLALLLSFGGIANAAPPFGNPADVEDAAALWKSLEEASLVGPNGIQTAPFPGIKPHGLVLEMLESNVTVNGHTGAVIVKRNYGGPGLSPEAVINNPDKFLKAVTVMFRRETGYDAENWDWFWVKYAPSGEVLKNPKGMSLAGRVAKGKPKGCIACHKTAPGGDFVFKHNRLK